MYRVAVVRGGPSSEHDVSMRTGGAVIEALTHSDFTPLDIVVTRAGEWVKDGKVWQPIQLLQAVDVVFIALHGSYGEDGVLQRYLEAHNIPYTGSNAFASSIAINKALAKDRLSHLDFKLAPHLYLNREAVTDPHRYSASVGEIFNGPYVVKPALGGSSLDTKIVGSTHELGLVLEDLFSRHEKVMVEQKITGREATVGVINNFRDQEHYTLPVIEIVPKQSFFDYEAKYSGETEEICPGRFSSAEKTLLMSAAQAVHGTLGLRQYSRSDFIVGDDGIYFLEVNTLPGLTRESLFPKALDSVGVSYQAFINHLILDAMRHALN